MPICVSYGCHTVSCLPSPQHIVGAVPVTGVPILGGCTNEFLAPPSSAGPFLFLATLVSCCQPHCGPRVIHCHLPWYPSNPPIPSLRVQVLDFCWTYLPLTPLPACLAWSQSPCCRSVVGSPANSSARLPVPERIPSPVSLHFLLCVSNLITG